MKLSLLAEFTLLGAAIAWEIDDRCLHRRLHEGAAMIPDDGVFSTSESQNLALREGQTPRKLRGTAAEKNQRKLLSTFQLKMFWQEGYCWQEEWIERKWCMACQGDTCESGEQLWIEFCDSSKLNQKFTYLPVDGSLGGQIKTASANLCMERISEVEIRLTACTTIDQTAQIFFGVVTDGTPFELKASRNRCTTNDDHHPKRHEGIFVTSCNVARRSGTDAWTTFDGTDASNSETASELTSLKQRPSGSDCSSSNPCNICEGDCDQDEDCQGDFKCLMRSSSESVPGCFGHGISGIDYCFKSSTSGGTNTGGTGTVTSTGGTGETTGTVTSTGGTGANTGTVTSTEGTGATTGTSTKALAVVGCTSTKPCNMCEGDCDTDDDCAGVLVCHQKDGLGTVLGCEGTSSSRTDFCGMP